jgi:hypothetical protein
MLVGTGKARGSEQLLENLARGRNDHEFFWQWVLERTPHPKQLEYCEQANATVNVLATSNRWGKTTTMVARHAHKQIYKVGAEPRYLNEDGTVDAEAFFKTRYRTVHTADLWETARLVWDDALKLRNECEVFRAMIKDAPKTMPVNKFRTLGHDARGIDGDSYYHVSLDEAGWIDDLEEKMNNVILVRVADVRGSIDIVGTFKPGVSRDFYKYAVRASAATGYPIAVDHRDEVEMDLMVDQKIDATVLRYLREAGIDLDEFTDAVTRELADRA